MPHGPHLNHYSRRLPFQTRSAEGNHSPIQTTSAPGAPALSNNNFSNDLDNEDQRMPHDPRLIHYPRRLPFPTRSAEGNNSSIPAALVSEASALLNNHFSDDLDNEDQRMPQYSEGAKLIFASKMRLLGATQQQSEDRKQWEEFVRAEGFFSDLPRDESGAEECSICKEPYAGNDQPVRTECGHVFGGACLSHWTFEEGNSSCPVCRGELFKFRRRVPVMPIDAPALQDGISVGDVLDRYAAATYQDLRWPPMSYAGREELRRHD